MTTQSSDSLRGMSVRARLVGGFTIVLLLFLASGAIAITSQSQGEMTLQALNSARMSVLVLILAVLGGAIVIFTTVRSIAGPLAQLEALSGQLARGEAGNKVITRMPAEFAAIAAEMNRSADSLSQLMDAAMRTADEVATSATQLSSVSEQIAVSASHVATAMSDVSSGAASQVHQLNTVDSELQGVKGTADNVKAGAADVATLAADVERSASQKKGEIKRSLDMLLAVRRDVDRASEEVAALHSATAEINKFVASVGRIAEQTNLLALNAAIEAARAGSAGRGFAVVADEVRKLSEQAEASAADIVKLTESISERVNSTAKAMSVGVARVREVESLSHEMDSALSAIYVAATRMREAASLVTEVASGNASAVERAVGGMSAIARTAENHATAAQEISASTEQQSASCQQMTSAASTLLQESGRLRALVGGLRSVAQA